MNYRKATVYPSRSCGGRMTPTILVAHTTEGYGRDYLDKLFSGQILRDGKQKISVHWCIYNNGDVVEYAPWRPGEAVKCIHAGTSSWQGQSSCNNFALGYEIEHVSGHAYPECVIKSIIELNAMVKKAYPNITLTTHKAIAPGRKSDPTPPWDTQVWPRVKAAWEEEDMTEAEVRKIVAEELAKNVVGVWPDDLEEARQGIADLGILETRHPGNRAVSVDMFRVGLYRLAKKVGVCK